MSNRRSGVAPVSVGQTIGYDTLTISLLTAKKLTRVYTRLACVPNLTLLGPTVRRRRVFPVKSLKTSGSQLELDGFNYRYWDEE